ncbi:MAG: LytTR family DNA-binding domain-containing protein [Bacteroidota bacterium]
MIKTIIIDDEKKAVHSLILLLNEYCPEIEITGTAHSAADGIKEITLRKPDLVFLDVEMPHASGFDLLESLPERKFDVIFITAYDNFAIKAFKYSAVDYILKPVDIQELISAVKKVIDKRERQTNVFPDYKVLLENIKNPVPKKIAVPTGDSLEYIDTHDIISIEADRAYSIINLVGKKTMMVCKNLLEFQNILEERKFFRIHKSHLINLEHVVRLIRVDSGYVEMSDGSKIAISRRRREDFERAIENFSGNF